MRIGLLLSISLLVFSSAFAQQGERTVRTVSLSPTTDKQTIIGTTPFFDVLPFFSYFVEWPEGDLELAIRFYKDGSTWTDWETLEREEHNPEKHITQLYFGEVDYIQYQLKVRESNGAVSQIKIHFFNPGESRAPSTSNNPTASLDILACPCPMPAFQDRNDWCSTSNCPEHPSPSTTAVSHLIIHHSAGTNSSSDWAGVVRAIWDFHVNGNGWSDIGYNWLIDPHGVIYQGRGDNIQGAHFCAHNSKTMGVCVMGNFTNVTPAVDAISSLEDLLAWKSCDRGINPIGSSFHPSSGVTLPNLSGHRDGCNTECPGNSFYPLLPSVRQGVVDLIESNCTAVSTDDLGLAHESLILSPNPAKDQFSIAFKSELKGNLQWQLTNLYQQVVLKGQANKSSLLYKEDISINDLASGIYYLQLEISGEKGVWKMIKI